VLAIDEPYDVTPEVVVDRNLQNRAFKGFSVKPNPDYLTSRKIVLTNDDVNLILAGKIGSSIASQLGTMRVTEQIDALDIMGINSANFLILPKIIAGLFFFPIIVILSMSIGITGGYLAAIMWGISSSQDFIAGLNYWFIPFEIVYAIIKATFFSFLIISISAYHGYYAKGGAVDVGKASTKAVVFSSVAILLSNLIITKIILG